MSIAFLRCTARCALLVAVTASALRATVMKTRSRRKACSSPLPRQVSSGPPRPAALVTGRPLARPCCFVARMSSSPYGGLRRRTDGAVRRSAPRRPNTASGARFGLIKRRGRDSNPRSRFRGPAVFKTAPFDRSGTPPSSHCRRRSRALLGGGSLRRASSASASPAPETTELCLRWQGGGSRGNQGSPVAKTAPFVRSGTPPGGSVTPPSGFDAGRSSELL